MLSKLTLRQNTTPSPHPTPTQAKMFRFLFSNLTCFGARSAAGLVPHTSQVILTRLAHVIEHTACVLCLTLFTFPLRRADLQHNITHTLSVHHPDTRDRTHSLRPLSHSSYIPLPQSWPATQHTHLVCIILTHAIEHTASVLCFTLLTFSCCRANLQHNTHTLCASSWYYTCDRTHSLRPLPCSSYIPPPQSWPTTQHT